MMTTTLNTEFTRTQAVELKEMLHRLSACAQWELNQQMLHRSGMAYSQYEMLTHKMGEAFRELLDYVNDNTASN